MTSHATNRREGGFTSCCGCRQKFRPFTKKEIETVRAAQKLLGVPIIDRGECLARGGGGGRQRSQIHPQATQNVRKQQKTGSFLHRLT